MQINRLIFCLCLLYSSFANAQQDEFFIVPRWKVGDRKSALVTTRFEMTADDSTTNFEKVFTVDMEVSAETPDAFLLKVSYDYPAAEGFSDIGEEVQNELRDFYKVSFTYNVNKSTGSVYLANPEATIKEFAGIYTKWQKFAKVYSASPHKSVFYGVTDPGKIETLKLRFEEELGFLISPYGKRFYRNDTTVTQKTVYDVPLPGETVKMTTSGNIAKINTRAHTLNIYSRVKAHLVSPPATASPRPQRNYCTWYYNEVITFDNRTAWPTEVKQVKEETFSDGQVTTKTHSVKSVFFL